MSTLRPRNHDSTHPDRNGVYLSEELGDRRALQKKWKKKPENVTRVQDWLRASAQISQTKSSNYAHSNRPDDASRSTAVESSRHSLPRSASKAPSAATQRYGTNVTAIVSGSHVRPISTYTPAGDSRVSHFYGSRLAVPNTSSARPDTTSESRTSNSLHPAPHPSSRKEGAHKGNSKGGRPRDLAGASHRSSTYRSGIPTSRYASSNYTRTIQLLRYIAGDPTR